jgi:hypothetical protein
MGCGRAAHELEEEEGHERVMHAGLQVRRFEMVLALRRNEQRNHGHGVMVISPASSFHC